jgi:hypothetical protein
VACVTRGACCRVDSMNFHLEVLHSCCASESSRETSSCCDITAFWQFSATCGQEHTGLRLHHNCTRTSHAVSVLRHQHRRELACKQLLQWACTASAVRHETGRQLFRDCLLTPAHNWRTCSSALAQSIINNDLSVIRAWILPCACTFSVTKQRNVAFAVSLCCHNWRSLAAANRFHIFLPRNEVNIQHQLIKDFSVTGAAMFSGPGCSRCNTWNWM